MADRDRVVARLSGRRPGAGGPAPPGDRLGGGGSLGAVPLVPATIWAAHVLIAAHLGATVDAIVRLRRARPGRLRWTPLTGLATGAAVVGLAYSSLFTQTFHIPSSSMYPTFEIGDHRSDANDSRFWGVVPLNHVDVRAVGVWRPLARAGAPDAQRSARDHATW